MIGTEGKGHTEVVEKMCRYIEKHIDRPITLRELSEVGGYSHRYTTILFKEKTGKTPSEYIRCLRLSIAAVQIREEQVKIVEAAFDSSFDSHEGFTRAFSKEFGISPSRFQKEGTPVRLFIPGLSRENLNKGQKGGETKMAEKRNANTVFVQVVEKTARKYIVKKGLKATEYFEYCEEVGCDVWETLLGIKEAIDEPFGMWLPKRFRNPGTSEYIQGVEVPVSYTGTPPDGYETLELPACKMMLFQGPSFEDENFREAIGEVEDAIERFNPAVFGYEWATEDGPRVQAAPVGSRGYMEGRPVRKKARV